MEPSTVSASAWVDACAVRTREALNARRTPQRVCASARVPQRRCGGARTSSRGVPLEAVFSSPYSASTPSVRKSVPKQSSSSARPIAFHGGAAARGAAHSAVRQRRSAGHS